MGQQGGQPKFNPTTRSTGVSRAGTLDPTLADALVQRDTEDINGARALRRATCRANGIRQFYLEARAGPPVVLLHGFPETSFAWRFQIPALAARYRVIAPDLRGYGETDKPSKGYDKRTKANDVVQLMKAPGVERVALIGHDRGARVATCLVKDHPEVVDRLVVMDNVPTRIIARGMNPERPRLATTSSSRTCAATVRRGFGPVRRSATGSPPWSRSTSSISSMH
jgi:pimeloyl-ACP methyl ester carboxylesterase